MYKSLSSSFHKSIDFYAAKESTVGIEAMNKFGISKSPALVVLRGDEVTVYEGRSFLLSVLLAGLTGYTAPRRVEVGGDSRISEADRGSSKIGDEESDGRTLILREFG